VGYHIASEYRTVMTQWESRQSSIAYDRARRVSDWLRERQADARLFATRPSVRAALRAWYDSGRFSVQSTAGQEMKELLDRTAALYGYAGVYVLDRNARVVAQSSGAAPLSLRLAEISGTVTRTGTFRIDLLGDAPHRTLISFSGPVFPRPFPAEASQSPGQSLGVGILVAHASQTLFPILTREGVPTRTGETILARREGDDIVFFSPLRHVAAGSPNLRLRLSAAPVPARTALDGGEAFVDYTDYRGVPVLASTQHIPLTAWGLVRKIDREEALAAYHRTTRLEILAAALVLLALGGLLAANWRKHWARTLRAQEEHLRGVLESAPDAMTVVDRDGRIVLVNQQTELTFGYTRQELLGHPISLLVPERVLGEQAELYGRYFSDPACRQAAHGLESICRRKDGSEYPAELSLSPIQTAQKLLVCSTVRDVTERKRVERELQRLNHALRTISACNQVIARAEEESQLLEAICGTLVSAGEYFLAWVGYVEHDAAKTVRPVAQAGFEQGFLESATFTWADTERGRGPTGTAIRTGKPSVVHNVRIDPRAALWRDFALQKGFASSIALPLFSNGQVSGALTIYAKEPDTFDAEEIQLLTELANDLAYGVLALRTRAERVRVEQALQESEERLRLLLDSVAEGIYGLDAQGKCSFCNPAGLRLLGYADVAQLLGKDMHALTHHARADGAPYPEEECRLHRAFLAGERVHVEEESFWRADGSSFPAECWSYPISRAGKVLGCVVTFLDITERKRAQQEVAQRALELARSNAELEQFAYVASHDLQEPLRTVASYVQLLQKRCQGKLDQTADEFIGFIVDGAKHMQALISDLLTFSRLGTRGQAVQPTDCAAVLDRVLINLASAIAESGAVVTHGPLPILNVDPSQLGQLLQNLIANSIKFRGSTIPRIHVAARHTPPGWTLSVQDNGIGIDPQFAERIFEVFQRLHTRAEYPGTGIGLAICKKIVERHGGHIWVESALGKGATFQFTIPS
jgi:PAS domain S-box-containing protein